MPETLRDVVGDWGSDLPADRYARALAAAGVLAALETTTQPGASVAAHVDREAATSFLRHRLSGRLRAESPLLKWKFPTKGNGAAPPWMPTPEALDRLWQEQLELRMLRFNERIITDGRGRQRSQPPSTELRLELPADFELLDEATDLFVSPHTGIEALSALAGRRTSKPVWQWPVSIRLLADSARAFRSIVDVRDLLEPGRSSLSRHVDLLPDESRKRADLTILFACATSLSLARDSEVAHAQLHDRGRSVDADCVILALKSDARESPGSASLHRLMTRVGTYGLVTQPGMWSRQNAATVWVVRLIVELSHANTIDVAAMRAASESKLGPPSMRLARALLEHAHVSRRQGLLLSHLKRADQRAEVTVPASAAQELKLGTVATVHELTEALQARVTPYDFDAESNAASIVGTVAPVIADLPILAPQVPVGDVKFSVETPAMEAPKRARFSDTSFDPSFDLASFHFADNEARKPPSPRYLQAQLRALLRDNRTVTNFHVLQAGSFCVVRVRIGSDERGWPRFSSQPFPVDQLPPTEGGWPLQVLVFTNAGDKPQGLSMLLPVTGDSKPCEFRCKVGEAARPFKARVVVAHHNRVLQSAWLQAPVKDASGRVHGEFARGMEIVVKHSLDDLDDRSQAGAFVIVNDSLTDVPGVAVASGVAANLKKPSGLADTIKFIDDELSKVSLRPDKYEGGLSSPAVARLLCGLAEHGREMFEAIVQDQDVDAVLAASTRIQVVAADAEARLPIEFFYDRPAPAPDAQTCPGAAECLSSPPAESSGTCNSNCPSSVDWRRIVCPRGFWGMRKVIEWHRRGADHVPGGNKVVDGDFRIQMEPASARRPIQAFRRVLFAHSDRVDNHYANASTDVLDALQAASTNAQRVDDWDAWRSGISDHSPLLMVLLPHNDDAENAMKHLSIGLGTLPSHLLHYSAIDGSVINGPETAPGSIVMLLGCETGAPRTAYLGYVTKFRRGGASIILSTGSTVLGRQISPICVRLIRGLQAAVRHGPVPLGEVMLQLRREVLAAGLPIVLALSAVGDADWLIE
jgi:hypothetical protein